jgi:hypothetical protein
MRDNTIIKAVDAEPKNVYLTKQGWVYVESVRTGIHNGNLNFVVLDGITEDEEEITLILVYDYELMVSVGYCDVCNTHSPYLANTGGNLMVCDACTFINERESK